MKKSPRLKQLSRLNALREQDVDRLGAELTGKFAMRERYLANLARLEQLCTSSGPSGGPSPGQAVLSPVLSLNCGGYKLGVMRLAHAHRQDLALHESDLAHTRRQMIEAARRQQGFEQVLQREHCALQRSGAVREQKRVDEIASQVWMRGRE